MSPSSLETTLPPVARHAAAPARRSARLTILCHPEIARTGQTHHLTGTTLLSRTEPLFGAPAGPRTPLGDPHVSRNPLRFCESGPQRFELIPSGATHPPYVDGAPLEMPTTYTEDDLRNGVVIELGGTVALLWHLARTTELGPTYGLVGASDAIEDTRVAIGRAAADSVDVLLRGDTGVGKELVARALHEHSGRSGPLVTVNLAEIPPAMAASELFGHEMGAFTGATGARAGYFEQASGGTLLLDEIGEAPAEVQPMLLRALETRDIRRLGARGPRRVDVRIVAATDADLDGGVARGTFRAALFHRLSSHVINVPALRHRRDDIGRLLVHFLRSEVASGSGVAEPLPAQAPGQPWLPTSVMSKLVRYDWPGNVRQLRNVARQLVIANRGRTTLEVPASLAGMFATEAAHTAEPALRRSPAEMSEQDVKATLRAHGWRVNATADALGVPRRTLYNWIARQPSIRKARDLTLEDLEACADACGGNLDAMAERLEVSQRSLKLRMHNLGIRS